MAHHFGDSVKKGIKVQSFIYSLYFNLEIMINIYYNPHSRQQGELFHTKIGGLTSGASRGGTPSILYIYIYIYIYIYKTSFAISYNEMEC